MDQTYAVCLSTQDYYTTVRQEWKLKRLFSQNYNNYNKIDSLFWMIEIAEHTYSRYTYDVSLFSFSVKLLVTWVVKLSK